MKVFEKAPQEQREILLKKSIQDWAVDQSPDSELTNSQKKAYVLQAMMISENQLSVTIKGDEKSPQMDMIIEVNHGLPAIHITNAEYGDMLIHVHADCNGLYLTPDRKDTPVNKVIDPVYSADSLQFEGLENQAAQD